MERPNRVIEGSVTPNPLPASGRTPPPSGGETQTIA